MTSPSLAKDAPPARAGDAATAAPAVVAVVVAHDPGAWFERVLRSLAAQTYESLSVLVVDTASDEDLTPRVAEVLPEARVRRLDHDPGYGAAANQVLDLVEGASFYLLCHDDVDLAPGAVRALVEEAFRTNAGVLGPKLLDWRDRRLISSVGGAVDKTGVPAPFAERGELDQEQHDAVRDVFYVSGGSILVRADLFATLEGFDPGITFYGDDVDLCWRAHIAGARVVVVPSAQARHIEQLHERRGAGDRRRLIQRHRVRTLLSVYRPVQTIRVVPQALVLAMVEAIAVLLAGRVGHARDVVSAWTWNLARPGAIRRRRRHVKAIRTVSDAEVRELQVRGSARLTSFLRGQLGSTDDRLAALASTGRDLTSSLRAPITQAAVGAALFTLLLMAFGSRQLVFGSLPAVGEMSAFPASFADLLGYHLSGWRTAAGGGPGPSPTGNGVFGLLSLLTFGSPEIARKIVILGLLAAGPLAIWRLTRPIGSIRAGAAAVVVYAANPVPYNALADGAWSALAAYATIPWVVLGAGRVMGLAPFGRADLPDDSDVVIASDTSIPARALGIGIAVALGVIVSPAIAPLTLLVLAGLVVGSLVVGRTAGLGRAVIAVLGGLVVAFVLHLPWSASLLLDGGGWAAVVGADDTAPRPIGELLRFQTGPFGNTPLAWAFLVAAALPLAIGRGWRFGWAVRAWFIALSAWSVLLLSEQGVLPVALPPAELMLVPAAVGLSLAAALGMAAFEVDLRHYGFGWRQLASIGAAVAVIVGGLTLAPGVPDGRWRVPGGDLNRVVAPTLVADEATSARLLWIGDASVLPVGAHRFRDDVGLATSEGLPDVTTRWAGSRQASTDRIENAVEMAADRRTVNLGHILGGEGIRYIVVPARMASMAYPHATAAAPPSWLTDLLGDQIDLQRVDTDQSVLLYRNTAWRGLVHTVPTGEPLGSSPSDAVATDTSAWTDVVTEVDRSDHVSIETPGATDLVGAVPTEGWTLRTESGTRQPSGEAFGWAARFDEVPAGEATLAYSTPVTYRLLVFAQPVLWLLALFGRSRLQRRRVTANRRRATEAAAAISEEDAEASADPVTSSTLDPREGVTPAEEADGPASWEPLAAWDELAASAPSDDEPSSADDTERGPDGGSSEGRGRRGRRRSRRREREEDSR